jgi:hypothetical protein
MNVTCKLIGAMLSIGVCGCTSFSDHWRVNAVTYGELREELRCDNNTSISRERDDSQCQTSKTGKSQIVDLDTTLNNIRTLAKDAQNINVATTLRNNLQNELIRKSDVVCQHHMGDIIANGSLNNFQAGFLATTFSALSSIATGAAAKHYAASSTLLNAGKAQYNSDIYYGFLTPAIVREIKKDRITRLTDVRALQSKLISAYDADTAVADALDYHFRCSFYNGLTLVVEEKKIPVLDYAELNKRAEKLDTEIALLQTALTAENSAAGEPTKIASLNAAIGRLRVTKAMIQDTMNILALKP